MTDYRALCAELVAGIDNYDFDLSSTQQDYSVLERARAALAQPEPEGPTDDEIEREAIANANTDDEYRAFKNGAFFVQEHMNRPAIKPVPEGPISESELAAMWNQQADAFNQWESLDSGEQLAWAQARAIARCGRPAIEPVPVEERLPGPEECDAEDECYWFDPAGAGAWYLDTYQGNYTHWLPHHALPVPTTRSEEN